MRPAQKLTTIPVSCVDVGDRISYDVPVNDGLDVTRSGTVHRIIVEGGYIQYHTQEGGIIVSHSLSSNEPRVYMIQRAPEVQSTLELFDALQPV